jgi:hypothetical protein
MAETTFTQKLAEIEQKKKKAFEDFFDTPAIKLLVSMVPATEPPEILRTLLQSVFDHGALFGAQSSVGLVIGQLLTDVDKEIRKRNGGGDGQG